MLKVGASQFGICTASRSSVNQGKPWCFQRGPLATHSPTASPLERRPESQRPAYKRQASVVFSDCYCQVALATEERRRLPAELRSFDHRRIDILFYH